MDPLYAKKIEAYYEGFNVNMNAKAQYIEQTVRRYSRFAVRNGKKEFLTSYWFWE